jgi:hypothetical protein
MPRDQIEDAVLDSDLAHIRNLKGGRNFMAAVSPWFFTVSHRTKQALSSDLPANNMDRILGIRMYVIKASYAGH